MLYEYYLEKQYEEQSGYEEIRLNDFFDDAMESRRLRAKDLIGEVIGHQQADKFLHILSSAHSIDCEYAVKLAYDLGLDQLDFLAIDGDPKGFRKEYMNQY